MASVRVISGVGAKAPAAFLVEANGVRLLLDLGEGPTPGVRPDLSGAGPVDAIVLSHSHIDHAGALDLHETLDCPHVFATALTWQSLAQSRIPAVYRHLLPLHGVGMVVGTPVRTGRTGHSPDGIWVHLAVGDGLLYTGDWSVESELIPCDQPPPAATVITDASYGDRDEPLIHQIEALATTVIHGAVLPVPENGRGPEMVLQLARHGLRPLACPVVCAEIERLFRAKRETALSERDRELLRAAVTESAVDGAMRPDRVVIATDATADSATTGLLARHDEFSFVFTGHVASGTAGDRLLRDGTARMMAWNVHPRRRDVVALVERSKASQVLPAFCPRGEMPILEAELGDRVVWESDISVP